MAEFGEPVNDVGSSIIISGTAFTRQHSVYRGSLWFAPWDRRIWATERRPTHASNISLLPEDGCGVLVIKATFLLVVRSWPFKLLVLYIVLFPIVKVFAGCRGPDYW